MQTQPQLGLRAQRVRDLTYYVLLILSFFSIINYMLRELFGDLPLIGALIPAWKEGLIFLLYLLFFWKSKVEGRVDWKASRLHWLILFTFVATILSAISNWVINPSVLKITPYDHWVQAHASIGIVLDGVRTLLEASLYFLVLNALIDDEDTIKDMVHGMIVAAALVAAFGIYQKLAGWETPPSWTYSEVEKGIKIRVFSSIGNPNALGGFMVLITPIAIALTLWAKNWGGRIIYGSASLLMLVCLVLTYSRGAWIGFLAGMLVYTIITRNKWLAIVGIAGLVAAPFVAEGVVSRLTLAFTPEYWQKASEGGRVEFWARALTIFKEYPVFGTGIGTVGDSVATRNGVPGATWIDNQYFKLLAEIGIVGTLAYVAMVFTPVIKGVKAVFGSKQRDTFLFALNAGIVAALFGMLVENFTAAIFEDLNVITHFWTLIALLYVSIRLQAGKAKA
ncbi:O-antigen ligase family protein [Tumebacillus lipolyticus]|uniref:O-antigen ligase family protein n=1 Tax=Tumebacillus lipolyticus TaxID=1280370 RepID=A0ABW4ZWN0_9BACL